jgi:hypothetical protein
MQRVLALGEGLEATPGPPRPFTGCRDIVTFQLFSASDRIGLTVAQDTGRAAITSSSSRRASPRHPVAGDTLGIHRGGSMRRSLPRRVTGARWKPRAERPRQSR